MADLTILTMNGIPIEVQVKKITPEVHKPTIIKRDQDGEVIFRKRKTNLGQVFDGFKYITVNAEGKEYSPTETKDYEVLPDGSEELLKPSTKTKVVQFTMDSVLPATYVRRLLPVAMYEVYTEDPNDAKVLYGELEVAISKDMAFYVSPFVWKKGYTHYHAIFVPYVEDNSFGFVLMTTQGKMVYKHKMTLEMEMTKAKTVETLKPLLAELVV